MELALGKAPEALPLDKIEPIYVGNALRLDWSTVFRPSKDMRVVGNPPFIGQYTKLADQTEDLKLVWGNGYDGYLDYVTGWYRKAADYLRNVRGGRFAFVSTNSIAQGQPVPALFRPLLAEGWRIRFAHQTFAWSSEAPGMAHVHCVIIGFDRGENLAPTLYTYRGLDAVPVRTPAKNINPYLLDAPTFYVEKRSRPVNPVLPTVSFGSKPVDGGHLIIEPDEYPAVVSDPIAAKYVRPFRMGKELIHDIPRWCLWLEDLDPADLSGSTFLRQRIEACRAFRLGSKKRATREAALSAHLFAERRQPTVAYVGIPAVFSQHRRWATVQHLPSEVIAGNKIYVANDPDGFAFSLLSSSMFITWQKSVGGRLKSDPSFSNTVVWNNLPLPQITDALRAAVITAGNDVLAARALHPERSLADHYNPLAMDPALVAAHSALDKVVDRAFGAKNLLQTDAERQTLLFKRYVELTDVGQAGEAPLPRVRHPRAKMS